MWSKPLPRPRTLDLCRSTAGKSSNGQPYGGEIIDGKFTPYSMGDLRKEVDPDGRITEHRVRRSNYAHERMHSAGKLAHELYDAGERFRIDFEKAQLTGNYARLDMFKTRSGRQEMSDGVMHSKNQDRQSIGKAGPWQAKALTFSNPAPGTSLAPE